MPAAPESADPILRAQNIVQAFAVHGRGGEKAALVRAVSNVSFDIQRGETLGLVGESGSGKTTLARALLQIPRPLSGSVQFNGYDLTRLKGRELLEARRTMQIVFQDPFGSLNPLWTVSDIVEEPLIGFRAGDKTLRQRRVKEVLDLVGLPFDLYRGRRPRELSGGQCQRVSIARALALSPSLIVCDEAVSALDVLIQAQLLNLFEKLRIELGLSYLFISHDLALVKQISDRLAVLHLGQLCEIGPTMALYHDPLHPYTADLMTSDLGADLVRPVRGLVLDSALRRELPSPLSPPSGCRYRTRCSRAADKCARDEPLLREIGQGHLVACHFPGSAATPLPTAHSLGGRGDPLNPPPS